MVMIISDTSIFVVMLHNGPSTIFVIRQIYTLTNHVTRGWIDVI